MNLTDFKLEAGAEKPAAPVEAAADKGPKPGAAEMANALTGDIDPAKTKAEVVLGKLKLFGMDGAGDLGGMIKDKLGLGGGTEKGPDFKTDAAAAAKPEAAAQQAAKPAEFTDADFAGLADHAKPKAEATPSQPAAPAVDLKADQGPLDHTNESNNFILEEERRRKLGIPWSKWQEYKANEVAQAQAQAEADKKAAADKAAQDARNEQVRNMVDATRANIDAAGVQRRTEAAAPFVQQEGPSGLSPADEQKRRELGMSAQEYKNYIAQVQKEQQSRADSAKQEAEAKRQAQEAKDNPPKPPAEAPFKVWATNDAETDALGQEITKMQIELQQLKASAVPGDNRAAIASSESSLQHRIDSSIKKWKEMERKAYWKNKNEQPSPSFENFKLESRGGQVQFNEDGSVKREGPPVNTGALQQESDRVRASLEGKTEEERKRIIAAMAPDVRRVFDIDEQRAEAQRKQKLREEQAKQDAMNPDEAQQRKRQEAMAEWLKANPEPTGNPAEHAAWMSKLAAKTAELDAEDLKEAQRRQEIKAKATAAEPENTTASKSGAETTAATQPESSANKPETAREAELLKQVAEMTARMKAMEEALAAEKKMREDAVAAIAGNKDLMGKLPSDLKDKAKSNPWMMLASVLAVVTVGGAQTIGKMANADARGRVA